MTLKLAFILEAIDKATAPLRVVSRAVDRVSEPMRRLNNLSGETAFRFGRLMGGRLNTQVGEARDRLGKLSETSKSVAQTFGAMTLAAGGVFFAMKRTVDVVDRAVDVSKKLGITSEAYQRMGYAAQLNGSSSDEMGQALTFLSNNMVQAINGSKEMVDWFNRVGISQQQLRKMNVQQVFEAIADKFERVGDAGQNAEKKIAVMKAMLGRAGPEMKQTLDLGSAGLRKFYEEADRLGAVVDGNTAEAMADFNDNFDRMKFSIFGVMASITKTALPALDALVQRFAKMSVATREDWGKKIGSGISAVVESLPVFLEGLGKVLGLLGLVAATVGPVVSALGGLNTVIAVVSGLMLGKLAFALYSVTMGIAAIVPTIWTLGAALMATPLGWFIGIVAALVALAVLVVKNWEPISAFFTGLWDGVKSAFGAAYDWIAGKVNALLGLASKVANIVGGFMASDGSGGFTSEFDTMGNAPGAPVASAIASGGAGARSEVGGKIVIQLDQEGRAKVKAVKSNNRDVDIDVYSGMSMAGA